MSWDLAWQAARDLGAGLHRIDGKKVYLIWLAGKVEFGVEQRISWDRGDGDDAVVIVVAYVRQKGTT